MYIAYKITRGTIKAIVSDAAPWQIGCGSALGLLLGFLPILFPTPSVLGLAVMALVCLINCHIGSVLLFMGIGKLLAAVLSGDAMPGIAQALADQPLLYWSHLSHTGHLGRTILALLLAPLVWILMVRFTIKARVWIETKIKTNAKLVAMGKKADHPILVKILCVFLAL
jgi:hypothetical protein